MDFYGELAEQTAYELGACIGCHLCMRACPLPESNVISMGELNSATAGGPVSPKVLHFALDCTQCGACIPVCPADLHRGRMMLWLKLGVEAADPSYPVYMQVGNENVRSGWTVGDLAGQLHTHPLFAGVSLQELLRFIPRTGFRRYLPGQVISREGEYGETMYVILNGKVEISRATTSNQNQWLITLGAGQFAGEMAALSNQPRTATMTATEESILMEIPKAALYRMMQESEAFKVTMESLYSQRTLESFLKKVPLFQSLPEEGFKYLKEHASMRTYAKGEVICKEGEAGDTFYIVRDGFVKVSKRLVNHEIVLSYLREGDSFGESALLFGQPRNATVSANTKCELIEIRKPDFDVLLNNAPAVRQQIQGQAAKYQQSTSEAIQKANSGTNGIGDLACLIEEGLLQSHNLLLIDQRICIDCNNCEDACERRHGHSRLSRRGITVGSLLFPTACRHCEDPVCLLCSVNGIVRGPDGEIKITDSCIGCGACAARCPYDNIEMAPVDNNGKYIKAHKSLLDELMEALPTGKKKATKKQQELQRRVAVKCDLCAGYKDGPACVRNCPTGAAQRVDPVRYFGRAEKILQVEGVKR